jgi:hypothetical protein
LIHGLAQAIHETSQPVVLLVIQSQHIVYLLLVRFEFVVELLGDKVNFVVEVVERLLLFQVEFQEYLFVRFLFASKLFRLYIQFHEERLFVSLELVVEHL